MGKSVLDKSIYERDQLEELQLGINHGIDISIYENPEYMALQMKWIRKGLEEKIDVSLYASTAFDWFQMEEIYKGIVGSVDVSKYCNPSVSYERMREIRLGLEQGIDLSPFGNHGAKELRELRRALKDNVHIVKYIIEGYEAEQLEAIRKALAGGIDIEPYISKEYRGIAIEEITLGLMKGLSVEIYAKPDYSWQQMREIREGLEGRLDVTKYSSSMYSASQMHEIRLGLEAGLDVDSYRSLMFTDKDMRKKRVELLEELTGGTFIPMIPGKDGYHEYLFDLEKNGGIYYLQDGAIDFKRSFKYTLCEKGAVIAVYHEATYGKNGISDKGKVIKATKGKEQKILSGKGVYYDEENKSYIASFDGWIHLDEKEELLEVLPASVIDSINATTGRIVMNGNVEILGNIDSGVTLEIDGSLIVDGHVEAANIKCSGNIMIRGGINGNENAFIYAAKTLSCLYIENSIVETGEDVRTDYILSSHVTARGKIIAAGSRGSIIGSDIIAGKGIICKQAGNEANITTILNIKSPKDGKQERKSLLSQRGKILGELKVFMQARESFKMKYSVEERNNNKDFIKIEKAIYTENLELQEIETKIRELDKHDKKKEKRTVTVVDRIYEGVIVNIDMHKFECVSEKEKVVFELINGKLSITKG